MFDVVYAFTELHMLLFFCAAWQVKGLHPKQRQDVDKGWIIVRANKTLTNQRFQFNRVIDNCGAKPSHISDIHWNKMVKKRTTKEAKAKSEKMRRVAKGKGGKAAVMASLREAAVVKLVSVMFCMYT